MTTVRDIIEAARKNGLKHVRGTYYDSYENDDSVGACIMGQAFWNLHNDIDEDGATHLVLALDQATPDINYQVDKQTFTGLGTIMTVLNDRKTNGGTGRYRTYKELLQTFEHRAKVVGALDREIKY